MSISGHQDYWITGSRLYFQRDPLGDTLFPVIDLGTITNSAPAITQTNVALQDGDGGIRRKVAVGTVAFDENYEVRCNNFNPDNAALLWGATGTVAHEQEATPVTDIEHTAHPGRLMKILDATGQPIYGITSVEAVEYDGDNLVLGEDYEFVNPERGFIRFLQDSVNFPLDTVVEANNVLVSYTPREITDPTSRRRINPQTLGCTSTGTAFFFWGKCGNQRQHVRHARVQISPTGATFPDDNWADWGLNLQILTDPNAEIPAGELINWLGDLPTMS